MSAGSIDDFHRGLSERVGAANLDFEATMQLEHCTKDGADAEFSASNYSITSSPHKEWTYVVSGCNVCLVSAGRRLNCQPLIRDSSDSPIV
jgi:hypothetical protein